MDIERAINRVEQLNHWIASNQEVIDDLERLKEGGRKHCFISYYINSSDRRIKVEAPISDVTGWYQKEVDGYRDELEKLQGVIAMANAALKGVLSDER